MLHIPLLCAFGEHPSVADDRLYFKSFSNIYILGVFTEKLSRKSLECYIVHIPITTSSHVTSVTSE